jgi:hypothetical protein
VVVPVTTCNTDPVGNVAFGIACDPVNCAAGTEVTLVITPDAGVPRAGVVKTGEVKVTPETILDDPTDAGLFGIAFNTELTRKLSVTTLSPTVQALFKTTVVPVVAV